MDNVDSFWMDCEKRTAECEKRKVRECILTMKCVWLCGATGTAVDVQCKVYRVQRFSLSSSYNIVIINNNSCTASKENRILFINNYHHHCAQQWLRPSSTNRKSCRCNSEKYTPKLYQKEWTKILIGLCVHKAVHICTWFQEFVIFIIL